MTGFSTSLIIGAGGVPAQWVGAPSGLFAVAWIVAGLLAVCGAIALLCTNRRLPRAQSLRIAARRLCRPGSKGAVIEFLRRYARVPHRSRLVRGRLVDHRESGSSGRSCAPCR